MQILLRMNMFHFISLQYTTLGLNIPIIHACILMQEISTDLKRSRFTVYNVKDFSKSKIISITIPELSRKCSPKKHQLQERATKMETK